jgi:choline dehydrogenase-like flavoprotein
MGAMRAPPLHFAPFFPLLLEGAPPSGESADQLEERCRERLSTLPPERREQVRLALDLLASPAAVCLGLQRWRPFAALSPAEQARCATAWTDSALPLVRAAWQTVRRLVLLVHYAHPAVAAAIGYGGPFRQRTVRHPWEGPLPADRADTGPVARAPVTLPGHIDADPIPPGVVTPAQLAWDAHRTADVVVIGTGAGGAVTAARLAEAGFEVVVLEAGAWHTRADFTDDEASLTQRLYADGALRTTDDGSVALMQGEAAGGSTLVNWMIMLRTPDWVLEQWARESGVTGMRPHEMGPVFDRIEQEVRAARVTEDGHSANNRLLLDGARALGWRVVSGMINATGCVRCGFCGYGCRHNAKQSTLLTYLPRALAAGATVYTGARAERVSVEERDGGRVHGGRFTGDRPPRKRVHATVRDGDRTCPLTVDAPIVVVAGGAVGTPVLLQRSGLGGGGVGDWLRLHPATSVGARYDRDIAASTGIPLTTMCDEFLRWQGTDYGFWLETPPMHPSFTASAMPGFGAVHAERMAAFNQWGVLIGLTRDGAARDCSSGSVRADRRGRVSIRYRLSHEDEKRIRGSLAAMARLHFANGAREVMSMHASPVHIRSLRDLGALTSASVAPNRLALFSAHVNGTCRMGTDPGTSGTTPDGERHGVRGLYITDGSLLPTALGVNPQETIMAVSSVLAERLAARHAAVTHGARWPRSVREAPPTHLNATPS